MKEIDMKKLNNEQLEDLMQTFISIILCIFFILSAGLGATNLGTDNYNTGFVWVTLFIMFGALLVFDYWYYYKVLLKNRMNKHPNVKS